MKNYKNIVCIAYSLKCVSIVTQCISDETNKLNNYQNLNCAFI